MALGGFARHLICFSAAVLLPPLSFSASLFHSPVSTKARSSRAPQCGWAGARVLSLGMVLFVWLGVGTVCLPAAGAAYIDPVLGKAATELSEVIVQPDGNILVSGTFDNVQGIARPGLARLKPDGSLDETFNPALSGRPTLEPDGRILLLQTGGFLGGGLARLNANGSVDPSLRTNRPVHDVVLQNDGKILLAGPLLQGVPDSSLTRFEPGRQPRPDVLGVD